MSGALTALTTIGVAGTFAGASGNLSDILIRNPRALAGTVVGTVIPDCAIEEVGRDDLQITEHPVEQGSTISDHAYKKPREVTLRWSWSNSAHFSEGYVQIVYAQLLALQASRQPFTVYTGKCVYENMLIASLGQTTNAAAEYALNVVAVLREVIIVSTSVVTSPSTQNASSVSQQPVQSRGSITSQALPAGSGDLAFSSPLA